MKSWIAESDFLFRDARVPRRQSSRRLQALVGENQNASAAGPASKREDYHGVNTFFSSLDKVLVLWSQRFSLFFPMREPRSGEHESRSGEKEKPLVTLDLNLTFMQTPFCNYKFDAFDSRRLHESEIQVQGNQRFFFLSASRSRLVLAASRLSHRKKKRKTSGTRVRFWPKLRIGLVEMTKMLFVR